jgi:hypothetical protein
MVRRVIRNFRRPVQSLKLPWQNFRVGFWICRVLFFLVTLLIVWVLGGNIVASQIEKRIERAKIEFIKQFPYTESNDSALKLNNLAGNLGIEVFPLSKSSNPIQQIYKAPSQKMVSKKNKDQINEYLNSQLDKSDSDEIDSPSPEVQRFLTVHADNLEAIRVHILNSELPRWGFERNLIMNPNVNILLPSMLGLADLQKVILIDCLDKTLRKQYAIALRDLEVSWRLNQSLLERPEFIASLVALINAKPQAVVMRKMHNIPLEWEEKIERFSSYGLPKAFLSGLYTESFYPLGSLKNNSLDEVFEVSGSGLIKFLVRTANFFKPVLQPYLRFSGVDAFDYMQRMIRHLPSQDYCEFDPNAFDEQFKTIPSWWNPFRLFYPQNSWSGQWRKVGKSILRFELTQKVIRIKQIAQKLGSAPRDIPGIEVSTCRNARWNYEIAGKDVRLSFSKDLPWMKPNTQRKPGDLADKLEYRFSLAQSKSKSPKIAL